MGESIRPCIEAVSAFFLPLPCENKRRKCVKNCFCFHSYSLYVEKSKWIYIAYSFIFNNF
ncbi:hypothetical protein FO521_05675 [Bacillus pseudomycoides]|uniref:Uncharacterized protein n=1 Tax=Bacillus pseudomycoides TaxID=64104 RepID=A0AAJ2DMI2_9BACI|nr:hypothetical protein [Bacillus pseudomycoides]MDR4326067.1 hypothetical protein [Bacillus pseudomycoides]